MVFVRSALVLAIALLLLWFILGLRFSLVTSSGPATHKNFWDNLLGQSVPPAIGVALSAVMLWRATRGGAWNRRPLANGIAVGVLVLFVCLPLLFCAVYTWPILTGTCTDQDVCRGGMTGMVWLMPMITLVPTLVTACLLWLGIAGDMISQRASSFRFTLGEVVSLKLSAQPA